MNVTWETIKEEVGVSKHLIHRCIQRNMIPRDIYDAYRYGKKIYYIENEELVTKYMYMGIAKEHTYKTIPTTVASVEVDVNAFLK